MKNTFLLLFITSIICSCNSSSNDKFDDLLALDTIVNKYPMLSQFTSSRVSMKSINGIAVCDSANEKCKPDEQRYKDVLKKIDIPLEVFDSISKSLCRIEFKTYYRYEDYSIWVENGAQGSVYGYLINHNPSKNVMSFELDKRYHIGIGKQIRENIYYFSSNIN